MAERFLVAKMVKKNISYRTISEKTGSSTATVTRVAHWLNHGMGGYGLVLDRMEQ
jgi:TrpR-related protein YerC/YecD